MRSVVLDPDDYDWEGDEPPDTPIAETIIYEMHVRGFTQVADRRASPTRAPSPA